MPAVALTALALLLTGCSGVGSGSSAAPTASHIASAAPAAPSSAASASTGAAAGSTTGSSAGSTSTGSSGSGTTTAAGSDSGAQGSSSRCTVSQLSGSIADGGGGGSAGAQRVAIVLHDKSTASCTLQGWPGISFVGGGNGTQIGNSATLDRATPHQPLTLRPGGEVQAIVTVEQSGNWDSATCEPRVTDGFRVIPPGSRQSLFIGASGSLFEACASTSVHQLTTSALATF